MMLTVTPVMRMWRLMSLLFSCATSTTTGARAYRGDAPESNRAVEDSIRHDATHGKMRGVGLHAPHRRGLVHVELHASLQRDLYLRGGTVRHEKRALRKLAVATEALDAESVRGLGAPRGHLIEARGLSDESRGAVDERETVDVHV